MKLMKKSWCWCFFLAGWTAAAADFKLETRQLAVEEALALPTAQGLSARIVLAKPSIIHKEPPALSAVPLYGVLLCSTNERMGFRLEESTGTNNGFDRLIIDLNGNNDLTDDEVLSRLIFNPSTSSYPNNEHLVFGPFASPDRYSTAHWHPRAYAEILLAKKTAGAGLAADAPRGLLRLRPAVVLETTVHFGGFSQRWALLDGNGDFRLGQSLQNSALLLRNPSLPTASVGDCLMVDRNGSGKYELAAGEISPLGSLVTINSAKLQLLIAPDHSVVSLTPLPQVLARQIQMAGSDIGLRSPPPSYASPNGLRTATRPAIGSSRANCPPSAPT
jgi:hypothetical protein